MEDFASVSHREHSLKPGDHSRAGSSLRLPKDDNSREGDTAGALVPAVGASGAIVEFKGGESAIKPLDDEDLEVKLRRISEQVPVRISNTSGSSAGSGSGDFHQYRQMRRREQDRVHRMEIDYQKRMAEREFHQRREERLREAEERTAKKRALRQKKKESKKLKKSRLGPAPAPPQADGPPLPSVHPQPVTNNAGENQPPEGNGDSDDGDNELTIEQERLGAPTTQLVAGGIRLENCCEAQMHRVNENSGRGLDLVVVGAFT